MTYFLISSFLLCVVGLAPSLGQDTAATTGSVDKLTIAQYIDDVTSKARQGVAAAALRESMEILSKTADSYLNDRSAKVPAKEIVDTLAEITSKQNWLITLSSFLEDPLVQEGRKVGAGLFVLDELAKRIRATTDETQLNVLIAAISFTAEAIRKSIANAEDIYTYANEDVDKTVRKRWDVTGTVGYPGSINLRRRRLSARGDWTVGGNIGYGPGGWSGGVSLGYTWGKRRALY